MKPIAYKIDNTARDTSQLPHQGGYGVLYKCPQCDTPLCVFLGTKELFCHNCGESLYWGVIKYINPYLSDKLDSTDNPSKTINRDFGIYEKGLIQLINELNDRNNYEGPVTLVDFDTDEYNKEI